MSSSTTALNAVPLDTEVLIVGAGPVGLGMAIEFGSRGVKCTLVEQGDGTIEHPRTGLIAVRTMELARRWGIADAIRDAGFPADYELSMVFCTSLSGHLLARDPYPSMKDTPTPPETPEKKQRCPQSWMQPVLAQAADAIASNTLLYRHRLEGFTQDARGVTAQLTDLATGGRRAIRAAYMIGCDGAASAIREALGIKMDGRLLSYSVNILIDAPDLVKQHGMGEAERYLFVGPEGTWGNLTVIDGDRTWRLTVLGSEKKMDLSGFDADAWVRCALGTDSISFRVTSVVPWRRSEMLAAPFREGRVFLAGDALHTTSPTGGMGMNTGMQEVLDLGWKIEGCLRGWGGPELLESYEIERRPVAARNLAYSSANFAAWKDVPDTTRILEDDAAAAQLRAEVGEKMRLATRVEWESLGLQIGHRYDFSPICVPDGSLPTPDDYSDYVPTARPGSRAPHAWLPDGRSTLDLFGASFTLLVFGDTADPRPLEGALAARGIPLRVERIDLPEIAALYERKLVLVRPDGHVAWRGDEASDADDIAATISGHGHEIADVQEAPRRSGTI
jgi:2-polyprenyl-6-methoxyphenol hydroxylase-like FAD-dependent oxidoreductase